MTRHEAMIYWLMKYNKAKAHKDEHWDAGLRRIYGVTVNVVYEIGKAIAECKRR